LGTQVSFFVSSRLGEAETFGCEAQNTSDAARLTVWDADTHTAGIKVLSPLDYKMDFTDALKDMEFTVVHELVHLQLSSLPRNDASRSAEEKAVNTITQALLDLDRQK